MVQRYRIRKSTACTYTKIIKKFKHVKIFLIVMQHFVKRTNVFDRYLLIILPVIEKANSTTDSSRSLAA